MDKKKKLPPIQPAPVRAFTVRLIDGHFVRVPKEEAAAVDAATAQPAKPPAPPAPIAGSIHEEGKAKRTLRLVDGKWVRQADLATDTTEPGPSPATGVQPAPAEPPVAAAPPPRPANSPDDSWASAFRTEVGPDDLPSNP